MKLHESNNSKLKSDLGACAKKLENEAKEFDALQREHLLLKNDSNRLKSDFEFQEMISQELQN